MCFWKHYLLLHTTIARVPVMVVVGALLLARGHLWALASHPVVITSRISMCCCMRLITKNHHLERVVSAYGGGMVGFVAAAVVVMMLSFLFFTLIREMWKKWMSYEAPVNYLCCCGCGRGKSTSGGVAFAAAMLSHQAVNWRLSGGVMCECIYTCVPWMGFKQNYEKFIHAASGATFNEPVNHERVKRWHLSFREFLSTSTPVQIFPAQLAWRALVLFYHAANAIFLSFFIPFSAAVSVDLVLWIRSSRTVRTSSFLVFCFSS